MGCLPLPRLAACHSSPLAACHLWVQLLSGICYASSLRHASFLFRVRPTCNTFMALLACVLGPFALHS